MPELLDTSEPAPGELEKSASYPGGAVEYSVLGSPNNQNPTVIVPGFTEGRFVLRRFAHTLHAQGGREVIFPEQPSPKIVSNNRKPILDHHAEALLAILNNEALNDKPVDFITHSFGSLVASRAAQLADERGMKSFKHDLGSHTIFISPGGSNHEENLVNLGRRWASFMKNSMPFGKELDPSGKMLRSGVKNFIRRPVKTSKEIAALSKKEKMYSRLGKLGMRPFVIGYASDDMYPHKVVGTVLDNNLKSLQGYAMPVDSTGLGATNFEQFKEKTGLSGKEALKAWAHHYRNAGHNDLLFHPERTVRAVLPILNGDVLAAVNTANARYGNKML